MDAIHGRSGSAARTWSQPLATTQPVRLSDDDTAQARAGRPTTDMPAPSPASGGPAREVIQALQQQGLDLSAGQSTAGLVVGERSTNPTRQALGDFMGQLFEAVRAAGADRGSEGTAQARSAANGFAGGLNALVASMANGSTPAGLQQSYDRLVTQAGTGATPSLQSFLQQLQSQLGYCAAPLTQLTAGGGQLVNAQA